MISMNTSNCKTLRRENGYLSLRKCWHKKKKAENKLAWKLNKGF